MRLVLATGFALATVCVLCASAQASSVPIVNPGFETPATLTTTLPTGWAVVNSGGTGVVGSYNPYELGGGNIYYTGANSTTDPSNGGSGYPGIFEENLGYATDVSAGSGLEQTLGATLLANTAYTFTVEEGNRNGTNAGGFGGSVIELLAGSTVIASASDSVGPTAGTLRDLVAVLGNSNNFAALLGQSLSIHILTTNSASANRSSDWDKIRLDSTAVPEPGSIGMLVSGIVAILGLGRRGLAPRSRRCGERQGTGGSR